MKHVISMIALAVMTTSAFAFECSNNEAQFMGKVTSRRVNRIDQGVRDCYYKVEYSLFNSSMVCPLDQVSAETNEIFDYDCNLNLEVGQEVSGILLESKDGQLTIE